MLTDSLTLAVWLIAQTLLPGHTVLCQDEPSWHKYVRAPSDSAVPAKAVLAEYTQGDVTNAEGLIAGNAPTVLRRDSNSTADLPALVIDFGQNVVGLTTIEFAGSTNDSASAGFPSLRLAFSETLEFLGDRSDFTRSDNAGQNEGDPPKIVPSGTDQIAVKNMPYTWLDQWGCEFGSQVCSDGLHGFRYLKIVLDALPEDAPYTSPYGEVSIRSVSVQWSGFRGIPDTYTGWFECSDPDLTQWWYDGSYTAEMGTDVFRANDTEPRGGPAESLLGRLVLHDGAKRDRDPYVGDLAVAALTSYLTHDAQEASRNVLEDLALHQRADGWIPPASINHYSLPLFDYPLWWVSCSYDYVFYTGNDSYLKTYFPNIVEVLDTYYPANTDPTTSLLVRPSGYGDYAFIPRDGSAGYYSALYVLVLNRAAELADLLSRPEDATRWRERAENVSAGFIETLWDPAVGAFLDRNCSAPVENELVCNITAHAQDGNGLAILAGIANSTYARQALEYLASTNARPYGNAFYDAEGETLGEGFKDRVYPFISTFEIAARFESGDSEGAIDQIRRTWGWMATHEPGITHWEGIGTDGGKYQGAFTSLAHGWSTGVTPLLTAYVLGVKPVNPGFREWIVQPRPPEDLSWARGVVPTPYGGISVNWERMEDGQFVLTVDAPEGTNGTVVLPISAAGGDLEMRNTISAGRTTAMMGTIIEEGILSFAVQGGGRRIVEYPTRGRAL